MSKTEDMLNPIEYVAEVIFKYKRDKCQGSYGGGSISNKGLSSFFHCQWCGKRFDDCLQITYCPKFPFPKFGIVDLMRKLGERNIDISMRYDSSRDKYNFTLIGLRERICDTDNPLEALCQWLMSVTFKLDYKLTKDEIEYGKELESLALECLEQFNE